MVVFVETGGCAIFMEDFTGLGGLKFVWSFVGLQGASIVEAFTGLGGCIADSCFNGLVGAMSPEAVFFPPPYDFKAAANLAFIPVPVLGLFLIGDAGRDRETGAFAGEGSLDLISCLVGTSDSIGETGLDIEFITVVGKLGRGL